MKECKQCGKEYDDQLSGLPLSQLREFSYDPALISDARDDGFCSKWCEKAASPEETRYRHYQEAR